MLAIALFLTFASVAIISIRLCLRYSEKRIILRILTITWLVCLLLSSAFMAVEASQTYVSPDRVYRGYWYEVGSGRRVSDEYDYVGGEGTNPILMFVLFSFSYMIIGLVLGSSISLAKEKASESAALLRVPLFIGCFLLYFIVGLLTCGLYLIVKWLSTR